MRQGESHSLTRGRESREHKCFLLCLNEDMAFEMHVTMEGNTINCGPIHATGISNESINDEAREYIRHWAEEEAIRVFSS